MVIRRYLLPALSMTQGNAVCTVDIWNVIKLLPDIDTLSGPISCDYYFGIHIDMLPRYGATTLNGA